MSEEITGENQTTSSDANNQKENSISQPEISPETSAEKVENSAESSSEKVENSAEKTESSGETPAEKVENSGDVSENSGDVSESPSEDEKIVSEDEKITSEAGGESGSQQSVSQDDIESMFGAGGMFESDDSKGKDSAIVSDSGENNNSGGNDVLLTLDQGDIDQLMSGSSSSLALDAIVYNFKGEKLDQKKEKTSIEVYDFRNPIFLTEIELRQIRIRHEKFIYYLAARLSMVLRTDFGMKMTKLYTTPYTKFTQAIPNPTYINLFKVNKLNGVGIVNINPRLAMTIVNRMLGGKGHSIKDERYLTEIEMALMDDIMQIILEEWSAQWQDMEQDMSVSIIGHENNGRFLQTSPHDAIILVFQVEAAIGDCCESIEIGVPYYMIEGIIKKMQQENRKYTRVGRIEKKQQWLPNYTKINVPVFAEWNAFSFSVKEFLHLKVGDVIELPKDILSKTIIRFQNKEQFIGQVGIKEESVAVKILEPVQN